MSAGEYPTHKMRRIVLAAGAALALAVGLLAADRGSEPANASDTATMAKKKKKKKCKGGKSRPSTSASAAKRKRSKCRKKKQPTTNPGTGGGGGGGGTQQDPVAAFTSALQGSAFERVFSTQFTSGSTRYDFCQGAFKYYNEYSSQYSAGSNSAQGTWTVTAAKFNDQGTAAQGTVSYTSNSPDFPAGSVTISIVGQNQAYIGETEFVRTIGGASC